MHKVDSYGHQNNEFTNGDQALQIPRTRLEQKWLNTLQRELTRLVLQAGVALDDADDTQTSQVVMLSVGTIAALRACPVPTVPNGKFVNVFVRGAAADGDGNGGFFRWVYNSTTADDGASIIKPTAISSGPGRWHKTPLLAAGGSTDYATNSGHANSADTATNANHATSADSATNAAHATSSDSATTAGTATNANHATSADSATNATHANNADYATTAGSAASANSANSANSASVAGTANNSLALGGQLPSYYAQINSPALTGTPTAPTPASNDNSGRIITSQYFYNWFAANTARGSSGYEVMPSGKLRQWGSVIIGNIASGNYANQYNISFPIAFAAAPRIRVTKGGDAAGVAVGYRYASASGCQLYAEEWGNITQGGDAFIEWEAEY